jgi:hypothetical protein
VQAARVIVSRNGVVLIVRWVWKWKVRKREREGGRKAGTICPSDPLINDNLTNRNIQDKD